MLKAESYSAVSYSWSTGDTTMTIRGTADSTYIVTVTDAGGCTASAAYTVPDAMSLLSSYVIISEDDIRLYRNTVFEGGVGSTGSSGDIWLRNMTMVTASGTFISGDDLHVSSGSVATVQISSPAQVALPAFQINPYQSNQDVSVPAGSTLMLTGSIYDDITIGSNSTVTFTQSDLYLDKLYTKDNVTLKFADCTRIRIKSYMQLGSANIFNPDEYDVIVFAEDYAEVGSGSTVTADIYVMDGDLFVRAGTSSAPNIMKGLFIAEDVNAKDNTHWYINPNCTDSCQGATQPMVVMKNEELENNGNLSSGIESAPLTETMLLKAYPNPFTEKLNIEFRLPEDSKAALGIFNISGQQLAVVFEGDVKANQLMKAEYDPQDVSEGIIIYRLQIDRGAYYDKAILVK